MHCTHRMHLRASHRVLARKCAALDLPDECFVSHTASNACMLVVRTNFNFLQNIVCEVIFRLNYLKK